MNADVSEAARRLKTLREQSGFSMRAVAEHLGWPLTRYQHYEDRYRRRFLPVELARTLAELFATRNVDPNLLLDLAGVGPSDGRAPHTGGRAGRSYGSAAGRDLPILGAVKGGAAGFYFNEGEAKEYVDRPPYLGGVSNAFGLYVDGESMEPRYFAGELLYVNPNRPITRNCFVAVEMADGQGMIKQFISRTDTQVTLRQLNPPKDIRLALRDIKRMYRITGAAEPS